MTNRFVQARQIDSAGVERLDLIDGGRLLWIPNYLPATDTKKLFATLHATLAWQQSVITVFGRQLPIPRLNAWYGDEGCDYCYSGTSFSALPWTAELCALRDEINTRMRLSLNSALANLYRDGADAMGWHRDNEPELGAAPSIASLSLGGERRFLIRPRADRDARHQLEFHLIDGSLLLMAEACNSTGNTVFRVPKNPYSRGSI